MAAEKSFLYFKARTEDFVHFGGQKLTMTVSTCRLLCNSMKILLSIHLTKLVQTEEQDHKWSSYVYLSKVSHFYSLIVFLPKGKCMISFILLRLSVIVSPQSWYILFTLPTCFVYIITLCEDFFLHLSSKISYAKSLHANKFLKPFKSKKWSEKSFVYLNANNETLCN